MITESPVVNSWIERAVAETQLKERRSFVLEVLSKRFGTILPDVKATIQQQPSLEMLHDWHGQAWTAMSLEDFIAILRR